MLKNVIERVVSDILELVLFVASIVAAIFIWEKIEDKKEAKEKKGRGLKKNYASYESYAK